jgi:hypothetical protein
MKQRHPIEISDYYDPEQVEALLSAYASTHHRLAETVMASARAGDSMEQFVPKFKAAFPDRDNTREKFNSFRSDRDRIMNWVCFPWMKDGAVVPWVRYYLELQFVRYHVQAVVESDKSRYIGYLENRFGRRQYYFIQNAQETELPRIAKIIGSHVNAEGVLTRWEAGMRSIYRDLRQTGSKVAVKFSNNPYQEELHIRPEEMKPKVFIPYSEPGSDEISYLYFVQVKPEPHFKEYPFTPGHFLYDTSKNALLRSLAEEVLNDLDVPLPFTVPTAELVLGSMSGSVVPKTQYGVKLPQVVRE